MGDWAPVRANAPCREIKIYQKYCNLLKLLQSALETSTSLLESLEGIFLVAIVITKDMTLYVSQE